MKGIDEIDVILGTTTTDKAYKTSDKKMRKTWEKINAPDSEERMYMTSQTRRSRSKKDILAKMILFSIVIGRFKQMIQVLRINDAQAAQLHYTGGVHACIRCGEIPNQPAAIPCGHVGCENCLNDFFNQREGHKRCPAASCKNPETP